MEEPSQGESSGRRLLYRRQHIVSQYFFRLLVHSMCVVIRAGDDDRHIECGNRDYLITSVARHKERRITLLTRVKGLQPPQIAVFGRLINAGMRVGRAMHPLFTYDALVLPLAA